MEDNKERNIPIKIKHKPCDRRPVVPNGPYNNEAEDIIEAILGINYCDIFSLLSRLSSRRLMDPHNY